LFKKELEALRLKLKNGIISMPDYSFKFEKLLVENSIRDYANLGFWEVDGRAK